MLNKREVKKNVFERRTSTGSDSLIFLEASKFVLLSVFTLIGTILTEASVKATAQECKKSIASSDQHRLTVVHYT